MNKEQQALVNLFQASQIAKLSAQEHTVLQEAARTLDAFIKANQKKEEVVPEVIKEK